MSEDTTPQSEATPEEKPAKAAKAPKAQDAAAATDEKPAKAPKKEKAPALEDKPFADFIQQDYLPALQQTLPKMGLADAELKLEKGKLPVAGLGNDEYWQVKGTWMQGKRQFVIVFSKEDIQAAKFYCSADNGAKPSTLESFMIDERKVSLDLLLLYTLQRLNGQKWLVRN